jgi:hypothetical protein
MTVSVILVNYMVTTKYVEVYECEGTSHLIILLQICTWRWSLTDDSTSHLNINIFTFLTLKSVCVGGRWQCCPGGLIGYQTMKMFGEVEE